MPGRLLRGLRQWWRSYRYRFVPWIALNINHNPRTRRDVPGKREDKVLADAEVLAALLRVFRALLAHDLPRRRPHARSPEDVLLQTLGFSVARAASSLVSAGRGVFVTRGLAPRGAVVSMYPGTVYQKYEPIFFQSIGNPFIFRCLDGVLIDGNDKGISKVVYRSCSGRDRLGPLKMSDSTWLTSEIQNPLAVGQYVNNCSNDRPANVCYQEFDVPPSFPVELKQYLPNTTYSCAQQRPLRCVVLIALRDVGQGEELLSNYYTIVR
ncbi:SET domain-containing protein 9 isoform X2 [Pipistrellus kuhlii]|uniref:SET domain-containing protein 9 isoform X2 n=1 Tax=Pipistrellus kuhlii TaxID=59472 RepID=UPI001E26EC10|nr:SET domain-containing protein 9 isoform X2 [Pipistrellus kuhlii]